MKILFLTDNFPPESNAPAIRTHEHARVWVEQGHDVVVVTCAPNFPTGRVFDGYRNRLFQRETIDGIEVIRVWTYITANQGFAKRILDYVSFMFAAIVGSFAVRRPDVVVATSPQFFTAVAGWVVGGLKRRPWVFELRDLWPESIVAVGASSGGFVLDQLEHFSHFLYRSADLVVPVTRVFAERLRALGVPDERIETVTNGIDPDSFTISASPDETRDRYGIPKDAFVSSFVGTVGMAHGVGIVLDAAELTRDDPTLHYVIMGNGADRDSIRARLGEVGAKNVTLIEGGPRQAALEVLAASDASLVVLRDTPVFETVIPSKIFEAMALRRPIVLGVRGEAKRIVVDDGACGIAFPPEDAEAMVGVLERLRDDDALAAQLGDRGRRFVETEYRRSALAEKLLGALDAVVHDTGSAR